MPSLLHIVWFSPKETCITEAVTRALFLPPISTAPWIPFHLSVFWSTHNRCFVGIFMLKAERMGPLWGPIMTTVLANWWSAQEPLKHVLGSPSDGWAHCVGCSPHSWYLDTGPSGVTDRHSAQEHFALAKGSLPRLSQQGVSLSLLFIGLLTSVDTYFSGGAIFFWTASLGQWGLQSWQ